MLVNVFGKFPPQSLNSLLGPDDVELAMKRNPRREDYEFAQKRLGIDGARFGDDSTVIFPRQGLVAFKPAIMRNARSGEIAGRIALAKRNFMSEMEFIDDTGGWTAGAQDFLLLAGITAIPINFQGKPDDSRYFNKRAEIYFRMAEWVKNGGALPRIQELIGELTAPVYFFSANGKFQIEDKDQIKEKLGRSPDLADGLALTFSQVEMAGTYGAELEGVILKPKKVISDWDPFAG